MLGYPGLLQIIPEHRLLPSLSASSHSCPRRRGRRVKETRAVLLALTGCPSSIGEPPHTETPARDAKRLPATLSQMVPLLVCEPYEDVNHGLAPSGGAFVPLGIHRENHSRIRLPVAARCGEMTSHPTTRPRAALRRALAGGARGSGNQGKLLRLYCRRKGGEPIPDRRVLSQQLLQPRLVELLLHAELFVPHASLCRFVAVSLRGRSQRITSPPRVCGSYKLLRPCRARAISLMSTCAGMRDDARACAKRASSAR